MYDDRMKEQRKLEKIDDFLQKLKKVVRIVLYGPAVSQSDCRKTSLYQLPQNKVRYGTVQYSTVCSSQF